MSVTETVYKGNIRPWGKTRKSLSVIHIPETLAVDLEAWRSECPNPAPGAFIFANRAGNFIDTDSYRKRVLHKLARDLKLPKLPFQVIRRTIATLAQKKGTVKDVHGLMRHSRTATTTDVYMQEIPESAQSTVNSIHLELRKLPAKERRKVVKALPDAVVFRGRAIKRGAVSLKVFGNLTPNDTKRSGEEIAWCR